MQLSPTMSLAKPIHILHLSCIDHCKKPVLVFHCHFCLHEKHEQIQSKFFNLKICQLIKRSLDNGMKSWLDPFLNMTPPRLVLTSS